MLRLRPYKPCDAESIVSWVSEKETFQRWGGELIGEFPITTEVLNKKYIAGNGGCKEADNFYPMTACDGDDPVGHLIMRYLRGDRSLLRFGWVVVDANRRGNGYGRQMLRLALEYAFHILKVDTVTLGVYENNPQAHRCYLASGFRKATILEDKLVNVGGEQWKVIELEISKEEFERG